jgi:predicted  nucleic acid-binding Zn-ribbon protein
MSINGSTMSGVAQVLHLLDNPAAYQKALRDLQSEYERFKEIATLAGPATEIPLIRARLVEKLTAAEETLRKAEADAADLRRLASAEASRIQQEAEEQAQEVVEQAEEKMQQARISLSAAQSTAKEVEAERQKVTEESERLVKLNSSLVSMREDLEERSAEVAAERERLAAVAAKFKDAIGL